MNETTFPTNLWKVPTDAQNCKLVLQISPISINCPCLVKDQETLIKIICSEWNKSYFSLVKSMVKGCVLPCNCLPGNQFIIESRFSVSIPILAAPRIYPSPFVCARHSPKPELALFQTFPYTNADSIPERMEATHSTTNKKPSRYPYSKNEILLAVNLPLEKKKITNVYRSWVIVRVNIAILAFQKPLS